MSTFSESNVVRQKAGQPTGGQFAEKQRPASGITLSCPQAHSSQVDADARALDDITRLLGTSPEWSSPGDYLSDIANLAADSGRPHPGSYSDTDEFERDWQEYLVGRESTGTPDEKALDTIVHGLGTEEHWGATDLEWIAEAVAGSGRPHPGAPWTAGELERAMRAAALESGRRDPDELDRVTALAKEQGAVTAAGRPSVTDNALAEAWAEGHRTGWEHCQDGNYGNDHWDDPTPNPYAAADRPSVTDNALAEAWAEGHRTGWEHCQDGNYGNDHWDDPTPNPYAATAGSQGA